jgi:acetyl/propionyl-CoA carboxylase alpha subunit
MIFYARLKDGEHKIRIEKSGTSYTGDIDGEPFVADARLVDGPSVMSLIVNKRCYEIIVTNNGRSMLISTGGDEFEIRLEDELEHRAMAAVAPHLDHKVEEIKAPMPGVVVAIEVEEGQQIEAGGPVVIVEAMKMQNEISTIGGGRVKEVLVSPGEVVESKQTLAVIDRS